MLAKTPILVNDEQPPGTTDTFQDRVDIKRHDGSQIDELAVDARLGESI